MASRNTALTAIFFLILFFNMILIAVGLPVYMMEESEMAFWLSILWPSQAVIHCFILIYSLVRYSMAHQYRDLLLIFLSANLLIVGFFYMLTNTSSLVFSPFADRDRNRTLVASIGFILGPSIVLGSVTGTTEDHRRRSIASAIWGGLVMPLISVIFFISPEPVFITKPLGEGPLSLSPIAWIIILVTLPSLFISIYKVFSAWRQDHNTMDLALFYAMILWCCAIVLFMFQTNPLQAMELIWFSFFMTGTLIIAIAGVMSYIIDPQRELTRLVDIRSKELFAAKQESEYFLNLWGHKIGNLLQAITLHLEMATKSSPALELTRKTTLINRQVGTLIKIKDAFGQELSPIPLTPAIEKALSSAEEIADSACKYEITAPSNVNVIADEMLEFVFVNVCAYISENNVEPDTQITVEPGSDVVIVDVTSPGNPVSSLIVESLMGEIDPTRTTMSLDLFIVKILMERYGGLLVYEHNDSTQSNRFTLRFKRAQ